MKVNCCKKLTDPSQYILQYYSKSILLTFVEILVEALTSFAAITPGQFWKVNEGVEQIEEGPGDNNDVVDILEEHHHDGGVANTFEDGSQLANHGHSTLANILANRDLEEEEGNAADKHGEEVGDQEGSYK